jgi:predicted homoserine dehydrogenase-like protein
MNLFTKLKDRAANGTPVRVGMIGAGKFGTMFLNQARRLPGVHLIAVVDQRPEAARSNMGFARWPPEQYGAASLDDAARSGSTFVGEDYKTMVSHPAVDIVIECTGNPVAAVEHCLFAFEHGKHVINVTVEADAFVGPGLSLRAEQAGVVYSMAYGDQPALVCDLVDWARACGFPVVAAGRGHKWLPHYRQSTPETVWEHWGVTAEQAERGRLNPKMFNSFLDGSKPAIESAAICNATGLDAPEDGLAFPPGSVEDLPNLMRPIGEGGILPRKGMVEVVSSLRRDGSEIPYDIRNGVWVCFEGDTEYARNCFQEYKVLTDSTGRYSVNYKRWHLIGLELGISVASVGLRREATGVAREFRADVAAFAKRNLAAGEILDGEGGSTVVGGLRPAAVTVSKGYLPLGLAQNARLRRKIAADAPICWDDVEVDILSAAYRLRREMEQRMGGDRGQGPSAAMQEK